MLTLDRYEIVPMAFKFYSIKINQPCFCYVTKVKNTNMPILYPILSNFRKRSQYVVMKQHFKVSNLRWVRHVVDHPSGNMLTMVFTLGNLRSRKISYRLWGEYMGHTFDITPYFRHYYYNHIPREIPPADIKERSYYAGIN
jgi:hypothetical protein